MTYTFTFCRSLKQTWKSTLQSIQLTDEAMADERIEHDDDDDSLPVSTSTPSAALAPLGSSLGRAPAELIIILLSYGFHGSVCSHSQLIVLISVDCADSLVSSRCYFVHSFPSVWSTCQIAAEHLKRENESKSWPSDCVGFEAQQKQSKCCNSNT